MVESEARGTARWWDAAAQRSSRGRGSATVCHVARRGGVLRAGDDDVAAAASQHDVGVTH